MTRPPPHLKRPGESSPRLPRAYKSGSPLTARGQIFRCPPIRDAIGVLNRVPHPEREVSLRIRTHGYTAPSGSAEVEAQAKPALGSRGCKVIEQRMGAVPDGLSRGTTRAREDTMALASPSVCPELRQLTGPDYNSQTPPRASSRGSGRRPSRWPRS